MSKHETRPASAVVTVDVTLLVSDVVIVVETDVVCVEVTLDFGVLVSVVVTLVVTEVDADVVAVELWWEWHGQSVSDT